MALYRQFEVLSTHDSDKVLGRGIVGGWYWDSPGLTSSSAGRWLENKIRHSLIRESGSLELDFDQFQTLRKSTFQRPSNVIGDWDIDVDSLWRS